MANSVSKISIHVGANTSQLSAGMNQAAATVQSGMGRVQNVAQQATYAVDDFFAAFSTGGVAGGLRGAANNLSTMAASLGGIKLQLGVIAAVTIGQFLAKQFIDAKKEAVSLREAIDEIGRSASAAKTKRGFDKELRGIWGTAASLSHSGMDEINAAREAHRETRGRAIEELRASKAIAEEKRNAVLRLRQAALATDGHEHKWSKETKKEIADAEREAALASDEVSHREKVLKKIEEEGRALDELREKRKRTDEARSRSIAAEEAKAFAFEPFVTQGMRDVAKAQLEEVTDELNARRAKFSMADVFRMLPGANAMGSGGAIGAINAAMSGPQNARDAGVALQRQQAGDIKRIRELEEKKKGLLEVVGL